VIGEVLRQLSDEKFIVKASSGPRYIVGCRRGIDRVKLKAGTRVTLDMTTLTIMRTLPREVNIRSCDMADCSTQCLCCLKRDGTDGVSVWDRWAIFLFSLQVKSTLFQARKHVHLNPNSIVISRWTLWCTT
jgi:hypothetical protein